MFGAALDSFYRAEYVREPALVLADVGEVFLRSHVKPLQDGWQIRWDCAFFARADGSAGPVDEFHVVHRGIEGIGVTH